MHSSTQTIAAGTLLFLFAAKAWHDLLSYAYHRERMRTCRVIVKEGVDLVRIAVERGALADLGSAATTSLMNMESVRRTS